MTNNKEENVLELFLRKLEDGKPPKYQPPKPGELDLLAIIRRMEANDTPPSSEE